MLMLFTAWKISKRADRRDGSLAIGCQHAGMLSRKCLTHPDCHCGLDRNILLSMNTSKLWFGSVLLDVSKMNILSPSGPVPLLAL